MIELEDFADADGNGIGENLEGAGVLILSGPDAVFILRNTRHGFGLDASVATTGGATSGSVVFTHNRVSCAHGCGRNQEKRSEADCSSRYRRLHGSVSLILESIRLYPLHGPKSMKSVVRCGLAREPCAISFKRFVPRYDSGLGRIPFV